MNARESNWPAWVAKADHDLRAVGLIARAADPPWDVVCFHAQQTAEKMLKAFLVYHRAQPRKVHDLRALLEDCLAYDATIDELRPWCATLNAFSVDVRYPGALSEPDETEARAAIEAAERVHHLVLERLPRGQAGKHRGDAP